LVGKRPCLGVESASRFAQQAGVVGCWNFGLPALADDEAFAEDEAFTHDKTLGGYDAFADDEAFTDDEALADDEPFADDESLAERLTAARRQPTGQCRRWNEGAALARP